MPTALTAEAAPNVTILRRQNLLVLLQEFAENWVATGTTTKGIDQAFAERIQVSPSMLSQMKSGRPIGNKIAQQVEALCKRNAGWLDEQHLNQKSKPDEDAFITLARSVWRSHNSKKKKEIEKFLRELKI